MKIALIGAGPRNLMAFERLVAWAKSRRYTQDVNILFFDPFGIGGRVWNPNQNHELKMNSLAAKITLYTDDSIQMQGPVVKGPSLFEWATTKGEAYIKEHDFQRSNLLLNEIKHLNKYSYASRALFGIYQQWYFEAVQQDLPDNVSVVVHKEFVTNVRNEESHYLLISDSAAYQIDIISAALGEGTNHPSANELDNIEFANEHGLKYVPVRYPSEVDVDDIDSEDNVIIRGLGLSFIDYLSELTERRGGIFERDEHGNLTYTRSGDEPTIYASSRRGLPYHARGLDQKEVGETYPRYFLSDRFVNNLIYKKETMSGKEFITRIQLDVELTYYIALAKTSYPEIDAKAFEAALAATKHFKKILDAYNIPNKERIDWNQWKNPIPSSVTDTAAFTDFIKSYLQHDVDVANEGNKTAPFTSAMEKLRELRTNIRKVITHRLISDTDYVNYVINDFNAVNNFLAVGPPSFRIEQILALIKAGVLTLIGPGMKVETVDDHFETYSEGLSDHKRYRGNVLIEGRLPSPNVNISSNTLISNLLSNKLARIYEFHLDDRKTLSSGALDINIETAEMLDANGAVVPNFFVWGLPTEKRHWLTNGAPIPGVNDVRLRVADQIAGKIIKDAILKKQA